MLINIAEYFGLFVETDFFNVSNHHYSNERNTLYQTITDITVCYSLENKSVRNHDITIDDFITGLSCSHNLY